MKISQELYNYQRQKVLCIFEQTTVYYYPPKMKELHAHSYICF